MPWQILSGLKVWNYSVINAPIGGIINHSHLIASYFNLYFGVIRARAGLSN